MFFPLTRLGAAVALALSLSACGGGAPAESAATASAGSGAGSGPARQALRGAQAQPAAAVAPEQAAQQLMDFAESRFPELFPGHRATQSAAPFAFRHYPASGTYLGVVTAPGSAYALNGVYVMGGAFGNAPQYVGQLTDFITPTDPAAPLGLVLPTDKAVVLQGGSTTLRVTLQRRNGFSGPVQLTLDGLPAGASAAAASVAAGVDAVDLVIQAQPGAAHSLPTTATLRAVATTAEGTHSVSQAVTVTVRGPAGSVDTSFGGGVVVTPVDRFEDYANAVAVQADGRVLVAGSSATTAGTFISLVRHLRDGGLDPSFGNGGKLITPIGARNDQAMAVAVQPDGRIVVVGRSDQAATGADFLVLRYLADGTPDAGFGQGGAVITAFGADNDRALAVAIQPDGKIVVGGETQAGASTTGVDFALARYLPHGQLDPGFGQGGKVVTAVSASTGRDTIYALALPVVDGEQRILAVGGEGNFTAARYRADGSLDTSFGDGGRIRSLFNANIGAARAVVLLPGGEAVLAGGSVNDFAAVQLTRSGALDPSFGNGGRFVHDLAQGNWDQATALVRQADGKLVLGGWAYAGNSSSGDFAALRLLANGSLDTSFGNGGVVIHPTAAGSRNDQAHGLVLQADERVPIVRAIQAGEANGSNHDFALIRLWL